MKYIILALALTFTSAYAAEPETKKVCNTSVDAKTKKEKETCKTIKIHKKLEGTKVEDAKKAK